jgi:hypothetical protein
MEAGHGNLGSPGTQKVRSSQTQSERSAFPGPGNVPQEHFGIRADQPAPGLSLEEAPDSLGVVHERVNELRVPLEQAQQLSHAFVIHGAPFFGCRRGTVVIAQV